MFHLSSSAKNPAPAVHSTELPGISILESAPNSIHIQESAVPLSVWRPSIDGKSPGYPVPLTWDPSLLHTYEHQHSQTLGFPSLHTDATPTTRHPNDERRNVNEPPVKHSEGLSGRTTEQRLVPQVAEGSSQAKANTPRITPWKEAIMRGGYHEPLVLKDIPLTYPDFKKERRRRIRYIDAGEEARRKINSEIFDGKLIWLNSNDIPAKASAAHNAMSARLSRLLPFLQMSGPGGMLEPKRGVRMMVHGGSRKIGAWRASHFLKGRTFWTFWGAPAKGAPDNYSRIWQKFGAGYLEPKDIGVVDDFLRRKLKTAGQTLHKAF